MEKRLKLSVSLASIGFAGGVLLTHRTGTLFPELPVAGALGLCILFFGLSRSNSGHFTIVLVFGLLGLAYRVYSYLFPNSMMRFDPDAYAVRSQVIILDGSLSNIVGGFYQTAANFSVYGAQAALIFDIPVDEAYVIFPVVISIAAPLFAAALVRRVTYDNLAVATACGVATLGGSLIQYSNGPIPLSMAAVYFVGFNLAVVVGGGTPTGKKSVLASVFLISAGFTHKVAAALIFGSVAILYIYTALSNYTSESRQHKSGHLLVVSCFVFLVVQWSYLTTYVESAVLLSSEILSVISSITRPSMPPPSAATRIDPPLYVTLSRVSHYLVTNAVGAVGGLLLFKRRHDAAVRSVQAFGLASVLLTVPGIFVSSAPGFQRVYVYAVIPVAVLVGVVAVRGRDGKSPTMRALTIVAVVLVLVANPLSVVGAPDYSGTQREYLTSGEVGAKEFTNEYVRQTVYRDMFYGDEVVDFQRASRGDDWHQAQVPQPKWHPGLLSDELTEGTLLSKEYQFVAHRTSVDIYRLKHGRYRLTWDVGRRLDEQYHRMYDNGDVRIHTLEK